jgi:2-polyprenyl-6-methoxyphenol hydroxylase-like FAD-dependent oxidoreductase
MTQAIVMGGSIAGLCAAAALARNFDRVIVIERDPEPGPVAHRGAPQGHHIHALLNRGQTIMNDLFPGAFDALEREGAVRADAGTSFRWFQFGGWKVSTPVGVEVWYQSRPLLEHHLRQSLARNPKVEFRFGVAVEQPVHTDGRVTGLRLRDGSVIEADLTVDATGRGSRSATWLQDWGYGAVPEQKVRLGLGYVSGVFEPTKGPASKHCLAIYQHAPTGNKRTGFCAPLEHGRKIVTLVGYHGDHAPTEIGAFREWAKTLLRREIAKELATLELVGELHKFSFPEQHRRCYGRMKRLPERYLIIGDAMCSFDPTFGQGMSIIAVQAELLAQAARPRSSTTRLQRQLYRVTDVPFSMTANEAHRWSETTGWKPPLSRLQQAYLARVFEAANRDPEVMQTLTRVCHLLAPPTALFRPSMLLRVLSGKPRRPALAKPASPFVGELSSSTATQTGY